MAAPSQPSHPRNDLTDFASTGKNNGFPSSPLLRGTSGQDDDDKQAQPNGTQGFIPRYYLEYNHSRGLFDLGARTVKQVLIEQGLNKMCAGIVQIGSRKAPRFRISHSNGSDFIEQITSLEVEMIGESARITLNDAQNPALSHIYNVPLYGTVTEIPISKKPAITIDVKLCQRFFRAPSIAMLKEGELDYPATDTWIDGLSCRISDLSDAPHRDDRCIDYGAYKILTKFGGTHLHWGQRADSVATWFHMRCDVCEGDQDGNTDFFVQAPAVTSDDSKMILLHDHVVESIQSVPSSIVDKAKKLWPSKIR